MSAFADTLQEQVFIYLASMIVTVPLAKKAGFGAVLGYLIAGILLGPYAFGFLDRSSEDALHLAEFGVIMMLFIIGLELKPALLWKLRGSIFGLGGLQVLLTAGAMAAIAIFWAKEPWQPAIAIGMILALSSTAIVLQTLQERGLLKRNGGQASFAVLLFQDIAVIPMFALFPFLATLPAGALVVPSKTGAPLMHLLKDVAAIAVLIGSGKYLLRPLFRMIAKSKLREIFTAMALTLVIGTTMLMESVGLSPALGAFLAGVVLAESEYRHQLEVDIEPFKGLLLGVFFISVGAGIDFGLVREYWLETIAVVTGLIVVKWLVLRGLGAFFKFSRPDAYLIAFSLAQGGEFAFVLFSYTRNNGVIAPETTQLLTAAVAISMGLAPLLIALYAKVVEPRLQECQGTGQEKKHREHDHIDERDSQVIVAGIGRFGQTITRLLRASGYRVTVLDYDPDQVDLIRKFGSQSFFGDASNMDLLHSAGAHNAKILALAIDDYDKAVTMIPEVKERYPHLKIYSRAYDRVHAYKLLQAGVDKVYVETSGSAISMGEDALHALGLSLPQADRVARTFKMHNDRSVIDTAKLYQGSDDAAFVNQARAWLGEMEKMLQKDISDTLPDGTQSQWPRGAMDNPTV